MTLAQLYYAFFKCWINMLRRKGYYSFLGWSGSLFVHKRWHCGFFPLRSLFYDLHFQTVGMPSLRRNLFPPFYPLSFSLSFNWVLPFTTQPANFKSTKNPSTPQYNWTFGLAPPHPLFPLSLIFPNLVGEDNPI